MLLTISTTHRPATDLGYLLHKNPARAQRFKLAFGEAHVFYTEASEERCTAALLLDIDTLGLVRGPGAMLSDYVNDRAYVSSSFLCVAIARVFGTALSGRAKERPELATTPIPLEASLAAVPCRGSDDIVGSLFGPLGYEVDADGDAEARYRNVRLRTTRTVAELLSHVYVLLPVLDNRKHYWIGQAEVDKLLAHGKGWLEEHPERAYIVRRYLGHRKSLAADATARLEEDAAPTDSDGEAPAPESEKHPSLHDQRLEWVMDTLKAASAKRVADIGCGEGQLLRRLLPDRDFTEIVGAEASPRALEIAERRLKLRKLNEADRKRIRLVQTGLTYRDKRLEGFDAATVVEVVEHIDPDRLPAFEQALFGHAQPRMVLLTTPNREYNVRFERLGDGGLRHRDHRFEWSRAEFAAWARSVSERYGYEDEIGGIGPDDPEVGAPTLRGVFRRWS